MIRNSQEDMEGYRSKKGKKTSISEKSMDQIMSDFTRLNNPRNHEYVVKSTLIDMLLEQ